VSNWLYGVARHASLKAKTMNRRRRSKELEAGAIPKPESSEGLWHDVKTLLDMELGALPHPYRTAIVLCDLEGQTIRQAASHLGWPQGTVATRLRRGRALLAKRLLKHGLTFSIGALTTAVSQGATSVHVPASLVASTINATSTVSMGATQASVVSTKVAALTEGVLTSMFLNKLKSAMACCLAVCVLTAGAGLAAYLPLAAEGTRARPVPTAGALDERSIQDSVKVITKEMPFADFTRVEVSHTFQVEITCAKSFRTTITADENLFRHIKVVKDGSTLRFSLDTEEKSVRPTVLKATIAMPALEEISLAKQSKVTCKGFKSANGFQARVTEASTLDGQIEAEKLDLLAAGASRVTLKGSAKEAKIVASQGCHLFLADFVVNNANVTLKDRTKATVNVVGKLEYDVTVASEMAYVGNPNPRKGKDSGGSVVGRKSSTTGVGVGEKVPDFSLLDLNGRAVKFSELRKDAKRTTKGVIVLSFWCSTCTSCRRVEHHLDKLAKDYQGQALVLALDANAGESPRQVSAFAKKNGLSLPILLNPDGRAADVFGTQVTTTTVVIDGDGVLRYCGRFSEGTKHAFAEDALKAVLAGKEVAVKTTLHDG
jgi:thiol-disulfide isomerase/thioredoxin